MKKTNILIMLAMVLLVITFSINISAYECNPSSCPSGYQDKGVDCDVSGLNYECKRECYRPGQCGSYGGWSTCSSKLINIDNSNKGTSFTSPYCSEDSNKCYIYKAEGRMSVSDWDPGWGLEANSVQLIISDSWSSNNECSNDGSIWGLETTPYTKGRGSSGSSRSASIKYYAFRDNYCLGSLDGVEGSMKILFYRKTATWINQDTTYKTCSGEWDCESGDTKCEGLNSYDCENNDWDNQGKVVGECGVECLENYDCSSNEICENYNCIQDPCNSVTCDDKCQNSIKSYNGYCSNGECEYQTANCDFGCSGKLCANDPCKGVICDDKCENSIWFYDGNCVNGKCIYDSKDTCQFGCQNEPPLLALVNTGMCRSTPCEGVTCEDYCVGDNKNTLATEGKCSNGKCEYLKSNYKEYSEECGGQKTRWYAWVGIGIFIILSFFIIRKWKRKK